MTTPMTNRWCTPRLRRISPILTEPEMTARLVTTGKRMERSTLRRVAVATVAWDPEGMG
jgi:hypothetical protein